MNSPVPPVPSVNVLGLNVSLIDLDRAVSVLSQWIASREAHYVCIRDAHGVVLAQRDTEFRAIHNRAGMVTPDGMPVLWLLRWLSKAKVSRVYGPDLMHASFASPALRDARHFFFGGAPGVAETLSRRCRSRYPGITIVGSYAPPFGAWSPGDEASAIEAINQARPDIVWVGLGTPKQERWMAENSERIPGAVLIGVGAAFDFLAGLKAQAPYWMQRSGTEWIFRLVSEPGRLWRRYLHTVPRFIALGALQLTGLRRFPSER
jgi:N-acetylglucosaminyldiphosphoundecaprenol N-acetyl-beta-D-mannosaminyltransferase